MSSISMPLEQIISQKGGFVNHLVLMLFFGILSFTAKAQSGEPILYSVKYTFVHVDDTTKPNVPFRSSMLLDVAKSISRYGVFTDDGGYQQASSNQSALGAASQSVVGQPLAVVSLNPLGNEFLFQVLPKKQLVKLASIFTQHYLVEQVLPVINWRIHKEQRKIGNYNCQKATGSFAGRNYTAWFAPALPFSFGPWKLCGLPGLILEATDDRNHVQFSFEGFQMPFGKLDMEKIGYRPVKTSEAKLQKAKAQFEKDPLKTAEAMLRSDDDAKVSVMYQGLNGAFLSPNDAQKVLQEMKSKTLNNPIERTIQ